MSKSQRGSGPESLEPRQALANDLAPQPDAYRMLQDGVLTVTSHLAPVVTKTEVFFSNFDSETPAQIYGTKTTHAVEGYGGLGAGTNRFAGRMLHNATGGSDTTSPSTPTTLLLTNLPQHESINIELLFAAIDAWDGNTIIDTGEFNPDYFAISVDGFVVFHESFDRRDLADQSYAPPPGGVLARGRHLGFSSSYWDSAYNLALEPQLKNIPHTSKTAIIEFWAYGNNWFGNAGFESWGMDNLRVSVNQTSSAPGGVLDNDLPRSLAMTAALQTNVQHGQLNFQPDGAFTYTPEQSFIGRDFFTYQTKIGDQSSEFVRVEIEVRPAQAVQAAPDTYTVEPGNALIAGSLVAMKNLATGYNDLRDVKFGPLVEDTDYRVVRSTNSQPVNDFATTLPSGLLPATYLSNSSSARSQWLGIADKATNGFNLELGDYAVETTVTLDHEQARTARIKDLKLAVDDVAASISVNGIAVFDKPFTVVDHLLPLPDLGQGSFRAGLNVIRFEFKNLQERLSPLLFRIEGTVAYEDNRVPGVLRNDWVNDSLQPASGYIVSVSSQTNLWLAGMPTGSLGYFGDRSPEQSPVLVQGFSFEPGDRLQFQTRNGMLSNNNRVAVYPSVPSDGWYTVNHYQGPQNGISDIRTNISSVVGVFLGDDLPSATPAPRRLNFENGTGVPDKLDYLELAPLLKQVFYIGDGLTSNGVQQTIVAPSGATRLFLGMMDDINWNDNIGRVDVEITKLPAVTNGAILIEGPQNGVVNLKPDGSFLYSPNTGFAGSDTFTYRVQTSNGSSAPATVSIQVVRPPLVGDVNGDNRVNVVDFSILRTNFGKSGSLAQGDVDGDGKIDLRDFFLLRKHFGESR